MENNKGSELKKNPPRTRKILKIVESEEDSIDDFIDDEESDQSEESYDPNDNWLNYQCALIWKYIFIY